MNQPIRILTPSFRFLGEIEDYESLQFTRHSRDVGSFELHINLNKNLTEVLQEDNLVFLNSRKVGMIRHREIDRSDSDKLIIRGYTLKGMLSRRITEPPTGEAYDSIKAPIETAMKHYVRNNAVSPTDSSRIIPNLIIASDLGRGDEIGWDSRYKQLDEELKSMSSDLVGWDIHLDTENGKFVFDALVGKDSSVDQTSLPPVIFSIDFDNIKNQKYINSATGYKNTAYVGGQGEGVERSIVEIGNDLSGLERIETFIDARDIENDADLPDRGRKKLKELEKITSFESEVLPYGPFIYEQDWDVGDIVTVQDKKLGLTMNTPIPEVREIYEAGGFTLEVTFGNTVPTLIDKVKQTIDAPMTEKAYIPTKTSELENDAGYLTQTDITNVTSDITYAHNQISPSSTWSITHNLGKYPSVSIVDSSGNVVQGNVKYESVNKVTIDFSAEFSGRAYLN